MRRTRAGVLLVAAVAAAVAAALVHVVLAGYRPAEIVSSSVASASPADSEPVLRGVRVLAIGDARDSGAGRIATLELTPEQADVMAGALASGTVTLALRASDEAQPAASSPPGAAVMVLKYGIPSR